MQEEGLRQSQDFIVGTDLGHTRGLLGLERNTLNKLVVYLITRKTP